MASVKEDFVKKLLPFAAAIGAETGISPALIIAQSALETGWGKSVAGNNYFGVKSHGLPGGQAVATHEYVNGKRVSAKESFRSYSGIEESMRDYARFLQQNPRYREVLEADTLEDQILAMGATGYATDPNYGAKLSRIAGDIQGIAPSATSPAPFPLQEQISGAFGASGGAGSPAALRTTPSLIDGVGKLADVYSSDTRFSRERGITPKQGAIADYVVPRGFNERPAPVTPTPRPRSDAVIARTFSSLGSTPSPPAAPVPRDRIVRTGVGSPPATRTVSAIPITPRRTDPIGPGATKRDLIDFRFPPANQPVAGGIDRTVQMPPGARPDVRIPPMPGGQGAISSQRPVSTRNYNVAEALFNAPPQAPSQSRLSPTGALLFDPDQSIQMPPSYMFDQNQLPATPDVQPIDLTGGVTQQATPQFVAPIPASPLQRLVEILAPQPRDPPIRPTKAQQSRVLFPGGDSALKRLFNAQGSSQAIRDQAKRTGNTSGLKPGDRRYNADTNQWEVK